MGDALVRCRQRMVNFTKSLSHLRLTVEKESLNDIEKAGLIQFFEVAFELSWKVMKDYLITEGYDVKSPREAIKTAFDYGLISDGAKWLEALEKRNLAAHTYDESILDELEELITHTYYPMMESLRSALEAKL
jgi:nucleotidyltransferase substrate binding protein (TIGR01987 family)